MFGNTIQHEEANYQAGCYRNEFAAAHDLSTRTQRYPQEGPKAAALVARGRFVVVQTYPVYCRHTDAFLGMASVVLSDYPTRLYADKVAEGLNQDLCCGDDISYFVTPPAPREEEPADTDEFDAILF